MKGSWFLTQNPISDTLINFKDNWVDPIVLALLGIYLSVTIYKMVKAGLAAQSQTAEMPGGAERGGRAKIFWLHFLEYGQGILSVVLLVVVGTLIFTQIDEIASIVNGWIESLKGAV